MLCWCDGFATHARPGVRAGTRDLVLTPARCATTTGRILDARGRPLPGLRVTFLPAVGDDTRAGASTDGDGRFVVELLIPGREYLATAELRDEDGTRSYACGRLRGGAQDVELTARLE